MKIWRLIMIVLGVMIVTGALRPSVGGLIAYAMPDTSTALITSRPDRWLSPPRPPPGMNPEASDNHSSKSEIRNPKSEIPPPSPIDQRERISRTAALCGAVALLLGGILGLLLAILDQFMVYSRMAMSMVASPGARRISGVSGVSNSTFTPPPPVSL